MFLLWGASHLPYGVEFFHEPIGAGIKTVLAAPLSVEEGLLMLRRVMLLGGMLLVGVILLGGIALAEDLRGTFKQDDLIGSDQLDRIYGLGAADTLSGLDGNDDCYGGSGFDEVSCGPGNDRIDGGFGQDDLFGGPGNDTIIAADGQEDRVNCGVGTDTAYVDQKDIVDPAQATICENLFVATR
jgi:RTX calcium-binding nonapeptide repeat (4 copies)